MIKTSQKKKHSIAILPIALVALMSAAAIGIMAYSSYIGRDMASRYPPLVDAAMEIKLEAAIAHLWFEELISGDTTNSIDDIWGHLDKAEWYANAMLYGGQNNEGAFQPLEDAKLRNEIEETLDGLKRFRAMGVKRFEIVPEGGVGSDIDQRFDKLFKEFLASADRVETSLQIHLGEKVKLFTNIQNSLMIVAIIFSLIAIRALITNDTKRILNLNLIQEKEENLRITLDSIGDGVIATDTEGRITNLNPVAERLTGWSRSQAKGEYLDDVFIIKNAITGTLAESPVKKVLESGKTVGLANHTTLTSKTGELFHIADSAAPIRNESDEVTGVVLVFRNVTEEYEAQKELAKAQSYISNLVDSMPSLLVGVDTKGQITQWNSQAEKETNVKPQNAVGRSLVEILPRLSTELEQIFISMKDREIHANIRKTHKVDGETKTEDLTIYPLISNGIEGAVIRIDDVTEKVKLDDMIVQSEKMMSVGGLAAGMAHEINNPLAGMIQTAAVMAERLTNYELPANKRAAEQAGASMETISAFMKSRSIIKMLTNIQDSGKRAAEIVSNMLSFAKKDIGFSTHKIDVLVDQCINMAESDYDLKKDYDFKQIEIIREFDDDLPEINCAGSKIQQVLLNILRNGAEAMQANRSQEGTEPPKLVLRLANETDSKMIKLEIEDNGPGMPDEVMKRIFEPFFTTKPTDKGTGLGLSVSYFIVVDNHKGTMAVNSTLGSGTKFIIRLPHSGGLHDT